MPHELDHLPGLSPEPSPTALDAPRSIPRAYILFAVGLVLVGVGMFLLGPLLGAAMLVDPERETTLANVVRRIAQFDGGRVGIPATVLLLAGALMVWGAFRISLRRNSLDRKQPASAVPSKPTRTAPPAEGERFATCIVFSHSEPGGHSTNPDYSDRHQRGGLRRRLTC